jgi:hypothetical protein
MCDTVGRVPAVYLKYFPLTQQPDPLLYTDLLHSNNLILWHKDCYSVFRNNSQCNKSGLLQVTELSRLYQCDLIHSGPSH